jgi:alkylation response protein AidB-like acyl-CoA dehydrogenase
MCARAEARVAFGTPLAEQGVIRDWIAEARVRVEQLRLLVFKAAWLMVFKAAWLMDTRGNRAAHSEIQAIKIATPVTVEWILDKAIQVHGAAACPRTSRSPPRSPGSAPCGSPTARTRCTRTRSSGPSSSGSGPGEWTR